MLQILDIYRSQRDIIHQSELRTYTKVVLLKQNSSFHFVVFRKMVNVMACIKLVIEGKYIGIVLSPTFNSVEERLDHIYNKLLVIMLLFLEHGMSLRKTPHCKLLLDGVAQSVEHQTFNLRV